MLILLFLGCTTFFIAFSDSVTAEKASFNVADLLSRKTTVSTAELQTVDALFQVMLPAGHGATTFRVSSVKMANGMLDVAWSWPRAPLAALKKTDLAALKLPIVAEGDSLIVLETTVAYQPIAASVGLSSGVYKNMVANRPRFTAGVVKTD
ncbi:hypothetical protein GGR05_000551 [Aureimonas phyllosphaerae]|uniref:Uncharacterized protein n=1 Tax=Aureimonas phyllosphaerae TaxID=1166078 RepID=A0A7W6FT80_9HYPH|nr:hypothetical protein [Aureimonas phyllosphaerae]MBB3958344.1 hypothetical protein [Aureimonas phyllosphaerae]